ncbi:MAG TPA: TPM domain-containing protein [Crocinitomix sp.]|nr:TPM domain-containing protein [Crocinitomix sp.]
MKNIVLSLVLVLSSTGLFANGFPNKIGIINDYEGVLSVKQEKTLTRIIEKYQAKTDVKMLVVSTKNFKPAPNYKKYIIGLFTQWKYTLKQTKKGVLVLFSFNKKVLKIVPGQDVKSILTEKKLLYIIENTMNPKFLKEKHFAGLKKGIKAIYKTIKTYLVN